MRACRFALAILAPCDFASSSCASACSRSCPDRLRPPWPRRGSAGDQQYTDPFGATKTTSTQTATGQPTATTPAPATTTATVATAPGTTPVATAATSTASAGTGKTLPYTGLDLWTVSGLGLTLLVSGLLIRFRSRRA